MFQLMKLKGVGQIVVLLAIHELPVLSGIVHRIVAVSVRREGSDKAAMFRCTFLSLFLLVLNARFGLDGFSL